MIVPSVVSSIHAQQQAGKPNSVTAITRISQHSTEMRANIQRENVSASIDCAVQMVSELVDNSIPYAMYECLHSRVSKELIFLYSSLKLQKNQGRCSLVALYEGCQSIRTVLPRCYILVVLGSLLQLEVCEGEEGASPLSNLSWSQVVFRELLSICRAVLHPMRSLFLHTFILTVTRFNLPGEANTNGSSAARTCSTFIAAKCLYRL